PMIELCEQRAQSGPEPVTVLSVENHSAFRRCELEVDESLQDPRGQPATPPAVIPTDSVGDVAHDGEVAGRVGSQRLGLRIRARGPASQVVGGRQDATEAGWPFPSSRSMRSNSSWMSSIEMPESGIARRGRT